MLRRLVCKTDGACNARIRSKLYDHCSRSRCHGKLPLVDVVHRKVDLLSLGLWDLDQPASSHRTSRSKLEPSFLTSLSSCLPSWEQLVAAKSRRSAGIALANAAESV